WPRTRKRKDAAWRAGKTRTHASCASGSRRSGPARAIGPVWRNPGHAPSRRATPLIGGRERETGEPHARANPGTRSLGSFTIEYVTPIGFAPFVPTADRRGD